MDNSSREGKPQASEFDLDVMQAEIEFIGQEYDDLSFDDPKRFRVGRLLIRKYLAYRRAAKLRNSNLKRT